MMGLKKLSKHEESTDVLIELKISIHDINSSNSSNIVDSLLNKILNAAWENEDVEVESLRATYINEETAK